MIPILIVNTNATKEQIEEYNKQLRQYANGIIILNDRLVYKNQMLSENIEYVYEDIAEVYGITEFSNEDVWNFVDNINSTSLYATFFAVIAIYMFIIYLLSGILDAVAIAILGFFFARIFGIGLKFKATFNMGIHALTLPIILNAIYIVVNTFTGFEIKYFQWMYVTISYIYIVIAILMMKTDLMNREVELQKILEEQKKVRQELDEQKKEQEEKKKQKENEPEEEKKKEKKKEEQESDNEGLAPQPFKEL